MPEEVTALASSSEKGYIRISFLFMIVVNPQRLIEIGKGA